MSETPDARTGQDDKRGKAIDGSTTDDHSRISQPLQELGHSIDMQDVERLRVYAEFGPSFDPVSAHILRDLADRLEQAVRDIATIRSREAIQRTWINSVTDNYGNVKCSYCGRTTPAPPAPKGDDDATADPEAAL